MAFYDLPKEERYSLTVKINFEILNDLVKGEKIRLLNYFSDSDTYVRKASYQAMGKIYQDKEALRERILDELEALLLSKDEKVRQTAVNAAGEIGIRNFDPIEPIMEKGLFDPHPSVRNAVIGSIKKMGDKNPEPVLNFAKKFLHHPDKEIRREICHGIELREEPILDILPLLRELQFEKVARVRNTVVHVLGQIAYKKGCLEKVIEELKSWENKKIVEEALEEIIDVHERYKSFAIKTQEEVQEYIARNFKF